VNSKLSIRLGKHNDQLQHDDYECGMFVIHAIANWLEYKERLCRNIMPASLLNWMKQFAQNKQMGRKGSSSCNITEPALKTTLYKHWSFEGCDPLQAIGDEGIKLAPASRATHPRPGCGAALVVQSLRTNLRAA
jgi:hypothetical protein